MADRVTIEELCALIERQSSIIHRLTRLLEETRALDDADARLIDEMQEQAESITG